MTYSRAAPKEIHAFCHYTISTYGPEASTCIVEHLGTIASNAWPATNLALYVPFVVSDTCIVYEAGIGAGATAGGNFDIGIYNSAGTRLVSSGSTARTLSVWNTAALTDTELVPGLYYAAMSANGTQNYSGMASFTPGTIEAMGVCEQGTAFALPATATLTRTSRTLVPSIHFAVRSVAL